MISQTYQIFRTNKMGKPYVQSEDPSLTNGMAVNDMWLNPTAGTMKMWDGTGWTNMQWGESAIMDDCIANRVIADNISANKITTGILQSQDGSFALNLTTGEATLLNLVMGGQIEGNIIALSSNGLTRVRLRGKEGTRDITAGLIFEQRETDSDDEPWVNAGQIYFSYGGRQTYSVMQNYQIGTYNSKRPNLGYNGGSADGLTWRALSLDWLRAANLTYHGTRMLERETTDDAWTNVNPVEVAVGNCMSGTAVVANGTVTCTYKYNNVMQVDFNLKITTAGSGSSAYGISRSLLRQLNAAIPTITPMDGGALQIFTSGGALSTSYVGATFTANGALWQPSYVSSGALTTIAESAMTSGLTLVGTCYGTYDFED